MASIESARVPALFDVNVLIALHDAQHVHHPLAADWLLANADQGWASCPLTQNGCVRIMSQPSYPSPMVLVDALDMLDASCADASHSFWGDDISLLDATRLNRQRMHGFRQLTDIYLLALAVKHGGRFVTFDAKVPLSAVRGAKPEHLVVI